MTLKITVIGRGRVGGGLADLWRRAGHDVTGLGKEGGDASDADVVVVSVPGAAIAAALAGVTGLAGKPTIDTCNIYGPRPTEHPSLTHQIKQIIGGPTAKSFSTNFAAAYDEISRQRVTPTNLFAAEPDVRALTERLIVDAGYEPLFVGDIDPGARLLEDSSGLTRAIAGELGPFFYRYASVGEL
jgi:predicted dinucleotide-binding enzyme